MKCRHCKKPITDENKMIQFGDYYYHSYCESSISTYDENYISSEI